MTKPAAAALDLEQASRLVDAALAAAQIEPGERARLACAKTLLRLAPSPGERIAPENFATTLQALGLDHAGG
jgi:hypothetical protein